MFRLVVLAGLLTAAWLAREASWFPAEPVLPTATPHERYWETLEESGLAETPLGRAWRTASELALASPAPVSVPSHRRIDVDSGLPKAWGFRVSLKRGQRVEISVQGHTVSPTATFVDVFHAPDDDESLAHAQEHAEAGDLDHARGALRAVHYEPDRDRDRDRARAAGTAARRHAGRVARCIACPAVPRVRRPRA